MPNEPKDLELRPPDPEREKPKEAVEVAEDPHLQARERKNQRLRLVAEISHSVIAARQMLQSEDGEILEESLMVEPEEFEGAVELLGEIKSTAEATDEILKELKEKLSGLKKEIDSLVLGEEGENLETLQRQFLEFTTVVAEYKKNLKKRQDLKKRFDFVRNTTDRLACNQAGVSDRSELWDKINELRTEARALSKGPFGGWLGLKSLINKEEIGRLKAQADEIEKLCRRKNRISEVREVEYNIESFFKWEVPKSLQEVPAKIERYYAARLGRAKKKLDDLEKKEEPEEEIDEEQLEKIIGSLVRKVLAEYREIYPDITAEMTEDTVRVVLQNKEVEYTTRINWGEDELPYPAKQAVEKILYGGILKRLKKLFGVPKVIQARRDYQATLAEARLVKQELDRDSDGHGPGNLSYQLSAGQDFNLLKDFDIALWGDLKDEPEFRDLLGAEAAAATEKILAAEICQRLLTTAEHTDESITMGYEMLKRDGAESLEYNVLNAWREPGHSGKQPFMPWMDKGSKSLIYKYLLRQDPAVIAEVKRRNPAVGKIIDLMMADPDNFHRSSLPDPSAESVRDYRQKPNPVYYQIQEHLEEATIDLLRSDDEEKQFFALGLFKRTKGSADKVYGLLDAILAKTKNKKLQKEITRSVASHYLYYRASAGLSFLSKHFESLEPDQAEEVLSWADQAILEKAFDPKTPDQESEQAAVILKSSAEEIKQIRELYLDAFAGRQSGSLSYLDFETLKYLNHNREIFISGLREIRKWHPAIRATIWDWRADQEGKRPDPSPIIVFVDRRYEKENKEALLAYVLEHRSLPPKLAEAINQAAQNEEGKLTETAQITLRCMQLQFEDDVPDSLKNHFYHFGLMEAVKMMGADFTRYLEFALSISKALDWTEVLRFIEDTEKMGLIQRNNEQDLKLAGDFLREFGVASSKTLFKLYLDLLRTEAIPAELAELGVRQTGRAGVNEMRRVMREIRSGIIESDAIEQYDNVLVQETVATITRFETSQWRRPGKTTGTILKQLHQDRTEGRIAALPTEYKVGKIEVDRLDADKVKAFEFSDGFKAKYRQLAEDFDDVKKGFRLNETAGLVTRQVEANLISELKELSGKKDKFISSEDSRAVIGLEQRIRELQALKEELAKAKKPEELIKILLAYDKKDNPITTKALRRLLLVYAHEVNPHYSGDMHQIEANVATKEGAMVMMTYVEDLVLAEAVPQLKLEARQAKRLRQIFDFKAFQEDLHRLEQQTKKGLQEITCLPSRGVLAEFSGYFGDACWTRQDNIVRDNPEMTAIAFVRNLGDASQERVVGSTLLFETTIGGEKVIIIRGMNPMQNIITELSSESFVRQFLEYLAPIAKAQGATRILAPIGVPGTLTNRPNIDAAFKKLFGGQPKRRLDRPMTFNNYNFSEVTEIAAL